MKEYGINDYIEAGEMQERWEGMEDEIMNWYEEEIANEAIERAFKEWKEEKEYGK